MKLNKIMMSGVVAAAAVSMSACSMLPMMNKNKDDMAQQQAQQPANMQNQNMQQNADMQAMQDQATMNVVELLNSNDNFSDFSQAVKAAGIDQALQDPNSNFTVFAPTNAAFNQFMQKTGMTADQLMSNKAALRKVLSYHVVRADMPVYSTYIKPGQLPTTSGDSLTVTANGMIQDDKGQTANIVKADVPATNGVVHVVDTVLLP